MTTRFKHGGGFLDLVEYTAPRWAKLKVKDVPTHKYNLGLLPTPIHEWRIPNVPSTTTLYIKRDDLSGMELSGNKVRKLEFLLSAAVAGGHDCVITIGGIQSNHCRATAVAARYLGLHCHLILRSSKTLVGEDPGLVGNLLVERMVGAQVHQVSKEEYSQLGSEALTDKLAAQLRAEGLKPYVIPVGGSNAVGMWGYLEAVEEIREQVEGMGITDIVMACGSGATSGGLALGAHMSQLGVRVHGYGVCDDPQYFYDFTDALVRGVGADAPSRDILRMVQAKGAGYAISTEAELEFIKEVATSSGILLDPVYSGKAVYQLVKEIQGGEEWRGRRVLFIHTGGVLGMYDKVVQLQQLLPSSSAQRLQV